MNEIIDERLTPIVQRVQWRRFWSSLAAGWGVLAMLTGGLWLLNRTGVWEITAGWPLKIVVAGGLLAAAVLVWSLRRAFGNKREVRLVAERLEKSFPELNSSLLTALEQLPDQASGRFNYLQREVIREAIYHDFRRPWLNLVPRWQILASSIASFASLLAVTGALLLVALGIRVSTSPSITSFADAAIDPLSFVCSVEPGDAEIEAGTSLLVLARFESAVPAEVNLQIRTAQGEGQTLKMQQSLSDPVCAGRIENVRDVTFYSVSFEGTTTTEFCVTPFVLPRLEHLDVDLTFPNYTRQSPSTLKDVRRITAVAGTVAKFMFHLNKPGITATLTSEGSDTIQLDPEDNDPKIATVQLELTKSAKYRLELVDDQGRVGRIATEINVTVLANQPPRITLKKPGHDIQASALEEVPIQFEIWDDFGSPQVGITLNIPGRDPLDLVLAKDVPAKKVQRRPYQLELEALNLTPDDLVTYVVWAEDIDSTQTVRRTSSDIFFIEIRPFDEIYRQGQQPTEDQMSQQQQQQDQSQNNQNAQQAEDLAALQKQIITGTWNLLRRETSVPVSDKFTGDVGVLTESQTSARTQVDGLAPQVQDPKSMIFVSDAKREMDVSVGQLSAAKIAAGTQPLYEALKAQQAAYQNLLRLRAREHEVVRMNQQQSAQSSASQNNSQQQQMQQLDMQSEQNPYQQEKFAETPETEEARENRQVLNRLRELSRRQEDLNERIQELQGELEQAKTEPEQTELARQLKRLRDEQEQILRDSEELRERMQNEQNQTEMADQAQALDQARENLRQSTEALSENQLSRAAAQGARAQDQLQELKDEFQRRVSNQFTEEMKDIRDQAQKLDEQQQAISNELDSSAKEVDEQPSLRDENPREKILQQFQDQKERLSRIREAIQETVEKAEETEPLLAEELYDTYRRVHQQQPEESIQATARSLAQGFKQDAEQQNQLTSESIRELREGVERAAEGILGDETESLQRANEQLGELTNELKQEFDAKAPEELKRGPGTGQPANADSQSPPGDSENAAGNEPPTESSSENANPGSATESNNRSSDENQGNAENRDSPSNATGDPKSGPPANQNDSQSSGQRGNPGDRNAEGDPNNSGRGNPNQPRSLNDENDPAENPRETDSSARSGDSRTRDEGGAPRLDEEQRGNPNVPMLRRTNLRPNAEPLSGDDFRNWSDRLRDVEEMVNDEELQAEAARIRDRARELRKDMRDRHSAEPNWELVKLKVLDPLERLKFRVREELIKKSGEKITVPLDRDPVPEKYSEEVERYYQELGVGK